MSNHFQDLPVVLFSRSSIGSTVSQDTVLRSWVDKTGVKVVGHYHNLKNLCNDIELGAICPDLVVAISPDRLSRNLPSGIGSVCGVRTHFLEERFSE